MGESCHDDGVLLLGFWQTTYCDVAVSNRLHLRKQSGKENGEVSQEAEAESDTNAFSTGLTHLEHTPSLGELVKGAVNGL